MAHQRKRSSKRSLTKRAAEEVQRADQRLFDDFVEDVYVLNAVPDAKAVKAVPDGDGLLLVSGDGQALRNVVDKLEAGAPIEARKIRRATVEEVARMVDPHGDDSDE